MLKELMFGTIFAVMAGVAIGVLIILPTSVKMQLFLFGASGACIGISLQSYAASIVNMIRNE